MIAAGPLYPNQGDFLALQKRVVEIFNENKSAIVRVKAAYDSKSPADLPQIIVGTGFFISREGHILTNASIVLNPDRVWFVHEGVEYAAEQLGYDQGTNLALLKATTVPQQFSFLQLSGSSALPEPGTMIIRLGAPLELDPSPSIGIVSGIESRFAQHYFPCAHVRTTVPAGPGDGGAAFLDLNGRLLGIQVGSLSEISSTYVLPARAAQRIRDDLLFSGRVTYGWIGFEVKEESTVAGGPGLVVRLVEPETPAHEAGMLPGDQILQIGDYRIRRLEDLRNAMFYARIGEYVPVRIKRDEQTLEMTVRLVARPESEGPRSGPFSPGLSRPAPVEPSEEPESPAESQAPEE